MKPSSFLPLGLVVALALSSALAQEAAQKPAPVTETEVTLIPEQVPEKKKREDDSEEKKDEKKSKTAENQEEVLNRIHYREAYTRAQRDEKVQAEWSRAHKARTDLEKRDALQAYYTLLHNRILKIDPSVRKISDLRRAEAIRRLQQTRIDPTEPLDPVERLRGFEGLSQ